MDTTQIQTELTTLRADVKSIKKLLRKIREHQEDPTGERAKARIANNGFNRPLKISEELSSFLGLGADEMISRSQVTKKLNGYINEHGLKHVDNGRNINMDNKLQALLKPPSDVVVTFLNLQKYLSPHYIKVEKETATATASVETPVKKKKRVVKKVTK